ncbi:MAG: hypothetical protein KAJ09_15635, partial [Deltaproteobacteria bacterium]|nr:hypothetical protein [Deltaproteobacteria bacterium]
GLFCVLFVYPVHYHPCTPSHVVGVVQLFLLAGLVFMVAKAALSPHEGIVLDLDYFYRIACRGILWLCTAPLNSFRIGTQAFFSREVSAVTRLSRNPISIPKITIQYLHFTVLQMLGRATGRSGERARELEEMESRLDEMRNMVYDEDAYRGPIGLGILLAMIFLFVYGLIYFAAP